MSEIRIAQYFRLTTSNGTTHRYQNYFINEASSYLSESFDFAPFQAEGTTASLGGDNSQLRVLLPHVEYALVLVEAGNGNRLSQLRLTTAWITATGQISNAVSDFYVGVGAGFSETTIELRFRSAIDSVGSAFPARTLTRELVGPLPLNAELYLR
jgi:hypothetical protein